MSIAAIQLLITGRVQGVGYRAWCRRHALDLCLVGWVRNLHDGRVEVFAQGEAAALDVLEEDCRVGPRHASVDEVTRIPRTTRPCRGFEHAEDAAAPQADDGAPDEA